MKKVVMLASAFVLIAGLTFAQTPQTQDKAAKPAEKKEMKDDKGGCDNKTKAACAHSKTSKGCCASDKKAAAPEKSPEKK